MALVSVVCKQVMNLAVPLTDICWSPLCRITSTFQSTCGELQTWMSHIRCRFLFGKCLCARFLL